MFGSGACAMRVWLNPEKVAERGLTTDEAIAAIRSQNVQASAGVIGGPPYQKGGELQLPVNVEGRLKDPEEFGEMIIRRDTDGVVTRLKDMARVEIEASDYGLRSLLDNHDAVALPIFALPGANAIHISDQVRATVAELKVANPPEYSPQPRTPIYSRLSKRHSHFQDHAIQPARGPKAGTPPRSKRRPHRAKRIMKRSAVAMLNPGTSLGAEGGWLAQ